MAIEVPSPEDDNVLRHVSLTGGHRLLMWETGKTKGRGMMCRDLLGYAFWPAGQEAPLFLGEDFSPSPFHAIDGDDAIVALLGFLTLKPGDTDSEYFEKYSEEQLAWSRSDQCETLGFYLTIFDEDGEEDGDEEDGDQFTLITDIELHPRPETACHQAAWHAASGPAAFGRQKGGFMMFMRPALYKGAYYEVETTSGTEIVPEDVVGEAVRDLPLFCEGDILSFERVESGILCRLSAPGYMDCTPWSACKTVEEARAHLLSLLDGEDESEAESAVDSALRRL